MRNLFLPSLFFICGTLAFDVSMAQQHDPWAAAAVVPENAQPSASVTFDGGSVGVGVGYLWGHGTLSFGDKELQFKVSGISVADIGGAKITAEGDVYNLTDLRDFDGKYSMITAGVTLGAGGSVAYLSNVKGVVIKLHSTTEGLRFNLSADGMHLALAKG